MCKIVCVTSNTAVTKLSKYFMYNLIKLLHVVINTNTHGEYTGKLNALDVRIFLSTRDIRQSGYKHDVKQGLLMEELFVEVHNDHRYFGVF